MASASWVALLGVVRWRWMGPCGGLRDGVIALGHVLVAVVVAVVVVAVVAADGFLLLVLRLVVFCWGCCW